jgi:hypothetical protein
LRECATERTADFKSIFRPYRIKWVAPITNNGAGSRVHGVQSDAPIPGTNGDQDGYQTLFVLVQWPFSVPVTNLVLELGILLAVLMG